MIFNFTVDAVILFLKALSLTVILPLCAIGCGIYKFYLMRRVA